MRKEKEGIVMLPIDLVLIRHGQSEANLAKRRSEAGDHSTFTREFVERHSSSFHLTELGRKQAETTGHWLRSEFCRNPDLPGFDRYITSEYARARETAALLNLPKARWYRDVYLTERNWGDLDVCPENERGIRFGNTMRQRLSQPFFWTPPNGESFLQLCLRIDRVLDTLHRECSDKRVIIVCHGEVMQAFKVRLERMSQDRFRELTFSRKREEIIFNGQIIHYTRKNPTSGDLSEHANWVRDIRPDQIDPSKFFTGWREIKRPTYSNEDLLTGVPRPTT